MVIDGRKVIPGRGRTILDVAREISVYIPTLCEHKYITPTGACRLCIVEVEMNGRKFITTACTTPAEDNMLVRTNTLEIQMLRKGILELMLSRHPYFCLICELEEMCRKMRVRIKSEDSTGCMFCYNDGQCELQNLIRQVGLNDIRFAYTEIKIPLIKEKYIEIDRRLCVLCGRCVRVCSEHGRGVLTFVERGFSRYVGTPLGMSLQDAGCDFCGLCIDVCPTGAISEVGMRWVKPDKFIESICPYCSVGCKIYLKVKDGKIVGSSSTDPRICERGRFKITKITKEQRDPIMRRGDRVETISWDEAIQAVTDKLKAKNFALFISPYITNEDAYIIAKFAKALGLKNIFIASANAHTAKLKSTDALSKKLLILADVQRTVLTKYAVKHGAEAVVSDSTRGLKLAERLKIGFVPFYPEANLRGVADVFGAMGIKIISDFPRKQIVWAIGFKPEIETKYLILQDPFANSGDIIMPSAPFGCFEGTYTNMEGKVQKLAKVCDGVPDWWIICEVAKRLGKRGFLFRSAKEIFEEMSRKLPPFKNMAYDMLGMVREEVEVKIMGKRKFTMKGWKSGDT